MNVEKISWLKNCIKFNISPLLIQNIPLAIYKGEILKYKKVSTFELSKNFLIFVTYLGQNQNKISEDVYTLLTQI